MDLVLAHRQHTVKLAAKYDAVLARNGFDAVLIHSGTPARKCADDDQFWTFRPLPHFQHWLPALRPDCGLYYRPGSSPLLLRPRTDGFWDGPQAPQGDDFLGAFELRDWPSPADFELPASPHNSGRVALLADDLAWVPHLQLERGDALECLRTELEALRVHKSPYEQHCCLEANRIAVRGHRAVGELFAEDPAASEFELHLRYLLATSQDDVDTPYKNIVAMGRNAAVLHHVRYGRRAGALESSVLVDAGAAFLGYQSDITRTHVRGDGQGAETFRGLVDGLDGLQRSLCDGVEPGLPYEQIHERAHRLLAQLLIDLSIAKGSPDELVAGQVTRAFFPHGIGHSLGLQTHDVGCRRTPPSARNPFLRNTSTTARDQVFTIEPGCYFIDALLQPLRIGPDGKLVDWALVERLTPFGGARIEDNLVVTTTGHRNLTREAFEAYSAAS